MVSKKNPRTSFDIKSANLSHITLILKSNDLDVLEAELSAQFGNKSDYFDNDPVIIDFSGLPADALTLSLDLPRLAALLKSMHMAPFAVSHITADLMQSAQHAGLIVIPDSMPATTGTSTIEQKQDKQENDPAPSNAAESKPVTATAKNSSLSSQHSPDALIVDKPLRSGQQIYTRGTDLIITSVVSFGAEIIADGNIHVYAPLRGRVIAGAQGNTQARIFSTCFEPALFSIAGVFQTTDKPLPADVLGKPAMVHLEGESLIVTPIAANV